MHLLITAFILSFSGTVFAADADGGCADVAEAGVQYLTKKDCSKVNGDCRGYYYKKFLKECENAIKEDRPETSAEFSALAAKQYTAGDLENAEKNYSKAIELSTGTAALYYNRGTVLSRLNRTEEAVKSLSKAIKLDPSVADGNAYVVRGIENFKKGDYDGCAADFTSALKFHPDDARSYASRAAAYGKKKEYKKALADYSKAAGLAPDNAMIYNNRAQIYRKLGKTAEAQADEKKYAELSGK